MNEPTAQERLHRLASELVVQVYMAHIHDKEHPARELDQLVDSFEEKLLTFALDEIKRHMGNRASSTPYFGEHRQIDGVDHVWCGGGWMAMPYSDYVHWPIQLPGTGRGKSGLPKSSANTPL